MKLPGKFKVRAMTDRLRGTFGLFTSAGPTHMAYFSVRIGLEHLRMLKTAREVLPRNILRIQELMQRDIDDARVRDQIVKYLTLSPTETSARFFPPIVVAILAKDSTTGEIRNQYPAPDLDSKGGFIRREDKNEELVYEEHNYGDAFSLRIPLENATADLSASALYHGAELSWNRDNIDLLVLDGQHRLVALKAALGLLDEEDLIRGYEDAALSPEEAATLGFSSLAVSVIFPPQLYDGNTEADGLNLVSVFRQVFVDVNKNAKPVSIARNILLNERDLIAVFTRYVIQACILESELPKSKAVPDETLPLYCFEWDPIEGSETKINDPRAVSSVWVLHQALDRIFLQSRDNQDAFRTLLAIEDGDKKLDPAVSKKKGERPSRVTTSKFASWQRSEIEKRFESNWRLAITVMLTEMFPSKLLIDSVETRRLQLIEQQKKEKLNPFPRLALNFLLGTRSDQEQIHRIAGKDTQKIGRFDPAVCKTVVKQIDRAFLYDELKQRKFKPIERLYFSTLGQVQLFEFVFRTLRENLKHDVDMVKLAREYCSSFNDAFQDNAVRGRLFSSNEDWNSAVLERLGTQPHKQQHVSALLRLALAFVDSDSSFARLFGTETQFNKLRDTMRDQSFETIRGTLIDRIRGRLKFSPEVLEIADAAKRDQKLEDLASKAAASALRKLERFVAKNT